jgi:hypothetical protein
METLILNICKSTDATLNRDRLKRSIDLDEEGIPQQHHGKNKPQSALLRLFFTTNFC